MASVFAKCINRYGHHTRPHFSDDDSCGKFCVTDGPYFQSRLHEGEERFATYFAFLSLFTFSMLGLVISTNIFQIYMFWELVGVLHSSWLDTNENPSAVAASKSIHSYPVCWSRIPDWHPDTGFLQRDAGFRNLNWKIDICAVARIDKYNFRVVPWRHHADLGIGTGIYRRSW